MSTSASIESGTRHMLTPSSRKPTPRRSIVGSTPSSPPRRRGHSHRRYRKVLKDTLQGITKGDIRRLARRGGIKRLGAGIYNESRKSLRLFLGEVLHDAIMCVEHRRAQTIGYSDIIYALKRRGRTLYGFGPDAMSGRR